MEKIGYLPNGQWKLEKWDQKQRTLANKWADSGRREHLNNLPDAKGKLRDKMLNDLKEESSYHSRVNSKTGKKEHYLHRIAHKDDDIHTNTDKKELSSWTHDKDFTESWGRSAPKKYQKDLHIHSAWIPEEHIHSYIPTITRTENGSDFGWEDGKEEGEVMIKPHNVNIHTTEKLAPTGVKSSK
jgi:hypothetical protein